MVSEGGDDEAFEKPATMSKRKGGCSRLKLRGVEGGELFLPKGATRRLTRGRQMKPVTWGQYVTEKGGEGRH